MNKYAVLSVLAAILVATGTTHAQKPNMRRETHNPVKFDSEDEGLDKNRGQEVAAENRPLLNLPSQSQSNNRPDGALQMGSGPLVNTVDTVNFDGVAASGSAPPDTNMAVGPNDVVQWVNTRVAMYNKQGNIRAGFPVPGNAFWSGFGGACQTQNSGDPIIQYDAVANRWIASQFTSTVDASGNYYQCLAISKTSDPAGGYNRYSYAFKASTDGFPDYPKITVWKNAYFASYNMFNSTNGGWIGPRICAYDRTAMLAGTSALQECFNPGASYGSLVPSDLDGGSAFLPPSNTGYFLDFGNNSLLLWLFTPDFVTPANATLSGPISLPAASFAMACGGGTCIPQPSTTQKLDSLADRLMYRLAYRNFGDHEAMVVNQSVTAGTSVGIRWYEVRNPLTNPSIYQQGTYAPDDTYRWMGSAAMDKVGNIAVGYSASSSTVPPSIRYTGRETTDPLNTLQAEQNIITGGGSQTGGLSRWGDYSAMRIDPADDCTFWYTSEYLPNNGSFNWHTRIASFRFNSCGAGTPDFTLGATPASQTVTQGSATSYTVSVGAVNGFSSSVALSVSGLPTGATGTFTASPINPGTNSTLNVSTSGSTPAGTYTLTITGTSGSSHTTTVTLIVQSDGAPDFSLTATPASQTVTQGNATSYTVSVGAVNGFSNSVALSVSGLPSGATGTFTPSPINPGTNSTLNVSTSGSTPAGTYTLTITGTSGSSHTTTVTLIVQSVGSSPDFTLTATPTSQTISARGTATYSITVNTLNGFNGTVGFSVSGLPPQTFASFNPAASKSGTKLMVKAYANAPPANTTLTVTGTSGALKRTTTVTLTIQ